MYCSFNYMYKLMIMQFGNCQNYGSEKQSQTHTCTCNCGFLGVVQKKLNLDNFLSNLTHFAACFSYEHPCTLSICGTSLVINISTS